MSETRQHQGPHTTESISKLIEQGYSLYQSDQLPYFLLLAVAVELRKTPESGEKTIQQVLTNIRNLEAKGRKTKNDFEWEDILTRKSPEQVAEILESDSDNSQRLRSNFRIHHTINHDRFDVINHIYLRGKQITPAQILD